MEVAVKFYSQLMDKEKFNGEEPEEPFFGITFNAKTEGRKVLPVADVLAATKTDGARVALLKMLRKDCGLSGDMAEWLWFVVSGSVEQEKNGASSALTIGGVLKMEALPFNQPQWGSRRGASNV